MPNVDVDPNLGMIDRRKTPTGSVENLTNIGNYTNIGDMDTRLAAIGGYFTAARITQMSKNDKAYALRMIDDTAGIS